MFTVDVVDAPVQAKGSSSNLDAMLGDLEEDLSRQGAAAKQRGVCGGCGLAVVAGKKVVTALGRTWHPEVVRTFSSCY